LKRYPASPPKSPETGSNSKTARNYSIFGPEFTLLGAFVAK
jgi:hypothetical protein